MSVPNTGTTNDQKNVNTGTTTDQEQPKAPGQPNQEADGKPSQAPKEDQYEYTIPQGPGQSPYHVIIQHGDNRFQPPLAGQIKLEWKRKGSPGVFTFTTIKVHDYNMSFDEGDKVTFVIGNKVYFVGYVFTKQRDKKAHIQVTCYDQLRYFKNKFTYVFNNKTATDILKQLAKDYGMVLGQVADTKYKIPSLAKQGAQAFDIVLDALDQTLANTGKMYILYDKNGKLCLKDSQQMKLDIVIQPETAQNFDYKTTIDDETYNSVVLYYNPN